MAQRVLPNEDDAIETLFLERAHEAFGLGSMYLNGRGGLAKDDEEAVKWYRKAAEQGEVEAQTYLGFMYEQGLGGLPQNRAEAVKWYRKAAEQGYTDAKNALKRFEKKGPTKDVRDQLF
jgi:TPR repeat protein